MAAAVVLTAQIAAVSARRTLWKKIKNDEVVIIWEEGIKNIHHYVKKNIWDDRYLSPSVTN